MSEPIVFFGSGPVAAASLKLLAADFEIEAVITKPQPAHHKRAFPVLSLARELDLKILTAATTEEVSALFAGKPFKSRAGIIIDHGILLERDVIDYFPLGIINSHFSLLPRWRGADPISFAILEGDKETGVSLMLIVEELDEGPLIAQDSVPIKSTDTTPGLTDKLISLSHELLAKNLPPYLNGKIVPYSQPDTEVTYSNKLEKSDGIIDWTKPADRLEREVRAYAGWPRSRTRLGETEVIISGTHVADGSGQPGTVKIDGKQLAVHSGHNLLVIDSLIPAGKKEMTAEAFLAGYKV